MPRPPTAIDLFCGAGGMSCGLALAGIDVLAGFDADATAHRTFLLNHPESQAAREPADLMSATGADICAATGLGPGTLDIIAGGPPCQGFSMAGHRKVVDERNTLVFHFARLVRELQPRFFVMENVVGLLSMRTASGRPVLATLSQAFAEAGYRTSIPPDQPRWSGLIVNAADYGVPQRRRRILVFGARDASDVVPALGPPTHHHRDCLPLGSGSRPQVTVNEAIGDLPEPSAEEPLQLADSTSLSEFARWARRPDGLVWNHVPTKHRAWMVDRMAAQAQGTPLYDTWAHAWVRLVSDEPSPTVKENHNAPSVHPVQPRVLTPRECARLQSFPDSFRFEGRKSRQLVQVGNAVPPLLGRAIGEAFLAAMRGSRREAEERRA